MAPGDDRSCACQLLQAQTRLAMNARMPPDLRDALEEMSRSVMRAEPARSSW